MLSLTYVSSAAELLDAAELETLLAAWRPRNQERGLTGMLLYSDGNVIQVLEGPAESVEATFATIEADPRHHGVIVLLREQVAERAFPDWSMGFRRIGRDDLAELPGHSDFLSQPLGAGLGPDATSAHRLLEVFRDTTR